VGRVAAGPVERQEAAQEAGVVLQHLLVVRLRPVALGGVAEEAAPLVVEDAARGHELQRLAGHVQEVRVAVATVRVEEQVDRVRVGELWRFAEAAEHGIVF
jgi:hypothetical protein